MSVNTVYWHKSNCLFTRLGCAKAEVRREFCLLHCTQTHSGAHTDSFLWPQGAPPLVPWRRVLSLKLANRDVDPSMCRARLSLWDDA
jgi:hypothetical protein